MDDCILKFTLNSTLGKIFEKEYVKSVSSEVVKGIRVYQK